MRCSWAKSKEAIKYHDHQWCKETHDEKMLFKMLVLEGMQAGLSWDTILKKEEAYNQAFDDFDYTIPRRYKKLCNVYSDEYFRLFNRRKI